RSDPSISLRQSGAAAPVEPPLAARAQAPSPPVDMAGPLSRRRLRGTPLATRLRPRFACETRRRDQVSYSPWGVRARPSLMFAGRHSQSSSNSRTQLEKATACGSLLLVTAVGLVTICPAPCRHSHL